MGHARGHAAISRPSARPSAAKTAFLERGTKRPASRGERDPRRPGNVGGRGNRGRTGLGINVEAWIASAAAGMTQK